MWGNGNAQLFVSPDLWHRQTGSDGVAMVEGLPPGRQVLKAWAPGLHLEMRPTPYGSLSRSRYLQLNGGQMEKVTITLVPEEESSSRPD